MTQSDRDVSAFRVNLDVIQAGFRTISNRTRVPGPSVLDKPITPVNKYTCDYAVDRWDVCSGDSGGGGGFFLPAAVL